MANKRLRIAAVVVFVAVVAALVIALTVSLTGDKRNGSVSSVTTTRNEQPSPSTSLPCPSAAPTASSTSSFNSTVAPSVLTVVPSDRLQCHSTAIDRLDISVPDGFVLKQAIAHSRHTDRWMYRHDLIDNVCWDNQLNSTVPEMKQECEYNRSTVWKNVSFYGDPYAVPAAGHCNDKQLTLQGAENAYRLGQAYATLFDNSTNLCEPGNIKLESSETAQKNLLSLQKIYRGFCGRDPDPTEFPADQVMYDGVRAPNNPFFLRTSVCESEWLSQATSIAREAFFESEHVEPMRDVALRVANATGHDESIIENNRSLPYFLDNVWDCVVSHACHDLADVPEELWDIALDMDTQETAFRIFPLEYWQQQGNQTFYDRFVSLYYGYYFVTVLERMKAFVDNPDEAPRLYVQVTSDSIVSPMLKILGANAIRRPVWGSQVVYQLLQNGTDASFHVRILYEDTVIRMEPLQDFEAWVDTITPASTECSAFYDNFTLL